MCSLSLSLDICYRYARCLKARTSELECLILDAMHVTSRSSETRLDNKKQERIEALLKNYAFWLLGVYMHTDRLNLSPCVPLRNSIMTVDQLLHEVLLSRIYKQEKLFLLEEFKRQI